ncbi:uncharacterized protein si:dkey-56d12.4 [Xyrauchen texanus]|uniref:uncharacterized protein si:dkey-56d12.4 n=1 Tax=Xyrauchen texanus TaxID=154827 RepID=UPI002241BA74|nr:uncharacterized protein si:dkey-56d12.4 [Xyrauchen texanus]
MSSLMCSVSGCHNNWKKRREILQQECYIHKSRRSECCGAPYSLHPPPKEENSLRLWLKALNLKKPPKRPYVCSFHFVDGRPTEKHPFPEKWLGYDVPVKTPRRALKRQPPDELPSTSYAVKLEEDIPCSKKDAQTQWEDPTLQDHDYAGEFQVKPPTSDKGIQCSTPMYKSLLRSDNLCQLHTGLSLDVFYRVAEHLVPLCNNNFQQDPRDQLLMVLMKLRLNLLQEYLAEKFQVSQTTVSRTLSYWIDLMEENMKDYIPWLPSETIKARMPECFKEHYPNTTCIIDCSETPLQKAKNPASRGESYSHHYGHNTIKYLLAIAPCGLVMFISPAYGGGCSDAFITQKSGFLDYLHDGDEVMADRGFTIQDLLNAKNVKLTRPSFTKKGSQLSDEDTTSTRRIANVSFHIERVICRLKHFKILSQTVPINLTPKMDKILRICAALCNLRHDIFDESEIAVCNK